MAYLFIVHASASPHTFYANQPNTSVTLQDSSLNLRTFLAIQSSFQDMSPVSELPPSTNTMSLVIFL